MCASVRVFYLLICLRKTPSCGKIIFLVPLSNNTSVCLYFIQHLEFVEAMQEPFRCCCCVGQCNYCSFCCCCCGCQRSGGCCVGQCKYCSFCCSCCGCCLNKLRERYWRGALAYIIIHTHTQTHTHTQKKTNTKHNNTP